MNQEINSEICPSCGSNKKSQEITTFPSDSNQAKEGAVTEKKNGADILKQMQEMMTKEMEAAAKKGDVWAVSDYAVSLKVLNPELDFEFDEVYIEKMKIRLTQIQKEAEEWEPNRKGDLNSNWLDFAELAANLKILGVKTEINKKALKGMSDLLKEYKKGKNWQPYATLAARLKMVLPEERFNVDKKTKDEMVTRAEEERQKGIPDFYFMSDIKLIDPNTDFKISEEERAKMIARLNEAYIKMTLVAGGQGKYDSLLDRSPHKELRTFKILLSS